MSGKQVSPVYVYDLTISQKYAPTKESLLNLIWKFCKKWCFQLESSESKYEHWQCRISLKEKRRIEQVIEIFSELKAHVSVTSKANRDNMFYVMKDESRIDGPYDEVNTAPTKLNYIQKRFRGEIKWIPYQETIVEEVKKIADDRSVNLLFDEEGGRGKSFLSLYLSSRGLARRIPTLFEYKEVIQAVMDMPKSTCYFIDLPRGLPKKNMRGLLSVCEDIKNGYVFDTRYEFREEFFEPPHVWVFTNAIPDMKLLSADRWKLWCINKENELVKYKIDDSEEEDISESD